MTEQLNTVQQTQKHPKGLYLCGVTQAWERFAFYGVKSVIIFFLAATVAKGGLGMTKADGAALMSTYAALTYLMPVIGGWVNDRFLGAQSCVILGALLMGCGYIFPFAAPSKATFYLFVAFVAVGTGLFKGNLNTLVGSLYDQNDPRKDGAFSIMYSFVNVGACIGPLVTGMCTKIPLVGFRYAFLVGAVGSFLTAIIFALGRKSFIGDHGSIPNRKQVGYSDSSSPTESVEDRPLTSAEKSRTIVIIILSFFAIFFWATYNQAGTSIAIYTNDYIDLSIGGFTMPVMFLDSFNGLLCVLFGPIMSAVWLKLQKSKRGDLNITQKMALGFTFLAGGFLFMVFAVMQRGTGSDPSVKASVIWVLLFYVLQTVGEMCFSPIGNATVNKLAPRKYRSLLMGIWLFSTFIALKLSGYGQALADKLGALQLFIAIPGFLIAAALVIFACNKKLTAMAEKFD